MKTVGGRRAAVFLGIVVGAMCLASARGQQRDAPGVPRQIRGAYLGSVHLDFLDRMPAIGINVVLPKFGFEVPTSESESGVMLRWAKRCKDLGLSLVPVFNWWGSQENQWISDYNRFVTDRGVTLAHTPCPYTPEFWDRFIMARFIAIAKAVNGFPLAGITVDMEMYGADQLYYEAPCFCDKCFARYMAQAGRAGPLPPPSQRAAALRQSGELEKYVAAEREQIRGLATKCREEVQREAPGLALGVMGLDEFSFPVAAGEAQGFGSPQLPVLWFSEKTYSTGCTDYIEEVRLTFQRLGANATFVAGLYQSKFFASDLESQIYRCATASRGYWIYTMESVAQPDYQPLQGTGQQYLSAIKSANAQLSKPEQDSGYQTPLRIEPAALPLPWPSFQSQTLEPLLPTASSMVSTPPWFRQTNWLYFYATKGDDVQFVVRKHQVLSYADIPTVGVQAPSGQRLFAEPLRADRPLEARLVAPESGVYGLAVAAGMNAVEVAKASHSYSVDISQRVGGASFVLNVPILYLPLRGEPAQVVLDLDTPNPSQQADATLRTDQGQVVWSGRIQPHARFGGQASGRYLVLTVTTVPNRAFHDLHIKAVDGLLPLAATSLAGLLSAP